MTGPYMVTEHTQGKSLKIDRNPVWEENVAAGLPVDPDTFNVDGFDVTIGVPPDAQVLQIKNGEADFSFDQTCCIGAVANELANDPAHEGPLLLGSRASASSYATFNVNVPPFDKAKVRQAVNYAVDREALVKISGGDLQGVADVRDPRRHDGAGGLRQRPLPDRARRRQGQGAAGGGRRDRRPSTLGRCTTPRPASTPTSPSRSCPT